jgi:hypothetical protein
LTPPLYLPRCTERSTSEVYACKNISKSTQSIIEW